MYSLGHEVVKVGLLLTLFGGCQRYMEEQDKIPVRGDPHILVVGDPGLGKVNCMGRPAAARPRRYAASLIRCGRFLVF